MSKSGEVPLGKLPEKVLRRAVLTELGRKRKDVVLWPKFGEDAGAVRTGRGVLVIANDPITGAKEFVGWLSVHVNANDVAVCGARPAWFSSCILMPKGSSESDFARVARQISRAANELGVAVVTGHSEIAPYVSEPIIIGQMTGTLISNRLITTSGARPGDWIVMSKTAGLEGSAILASDMWEELSKKGVDEHTLRTARGYYRKISVVDEALRLAKSSNVSSMHDPTEGGILGGLYELAAASGCGFKVFKDRIPVSRETASICGALGIDPLRLISSGVLLATIRRVDEKLLRRLRMRVIGRVMRASEGNILVVEGKSLRIDEPVEDELWRIIKR